MFVYKKTRAMTKPRRHQAMGEFDKSQKELVRVLGKGSISDEIK